MDNTKEKAGLQRGRTHQHPKKSVGHGRPTDSLNYALRCDAGYLASRIFCQPVTSRLNRKVGLTRILASNAAARKFSLSAEHEKELPPNGAAMSGQHPLKFCSNPRPKAL